MILCKSESERLREREKVSSEGGQYEKIKFNMSLCTCILYGSKLCNELFPEISNFHCLSYSMTELSKPH